MLQNAEEFMKKSIKDIKIEQQIKTLFGAQTITQDMVKGLSPIHQ